MIALCSRLPVVAAVDELWPVIRRLPAHKLTRLIYTMLTKGTEYTDQGQDYYEERYRQRVMHHHAKRAEKLGLQLTPIPQVA